ncbi:MAG: PAS domain S-box protein [Desulfobacteraceae bacterium]|nr:PAS domain S-box protein [Desulfobacteraceae bacterium]
MKKKPTYKSLLQRVDELETTLSKKGYCEDEIRETEEFMFNVLESIQDGISILNPDLTIRHVNGVMKKWHAAQLPLEGKKCFQCYQNLETPCDPCPTIKSLETGQTQMAVINGPLGDKTKWLEVCCYPITHPKTKKITGIVEFIRDITQYKEMQNALEASRERTRLTFNAIDDAIFLHPYCEGGFDLFTDVNETACRRYGYTRNEFLKLSALDITVPSDAKDHSSVGHRERLKSEGQLIFETTHINKSGDPFPVEINSTIIELEDQPMILAVARDITHRKAMETERKKIRKIAAEQSKLALIGRVAGKIAHDFNNILGIIMGNVELSLMGCNDAETKKRLNLVFEQTNRGRNLTRNLVAFAKDNEPKQKHFRLNEKVELILNMLKKDLKKIDLIRIDQAGVPDLLADPGMIEHALINLAQNAIHAVSLSEAPKISIRTYVENNYICLDIEDNGCGIPKEHLNHIYDPSFTLKGSQDLTYSYQNNIKGTGYGLSNVKKYIELHLGKILIESEFGSGTKLTIKLPVVKNKLAAHEKKEVANQKLLQNKFILLVEDEPYISEVQKRILTLKPCNHKVEIAIDGHTAIELFDKNQYDLVSLDYILPGTITGMDIYHHIRKTNKNVPILFSSGNLEFLESIKELKEKDKWVDHVSKPCRNKDYISSINMLLEKSL